MSANRLDPATTDIVYQQLRSYLPSFKEYAHIPVNKFDAEDAPDFRTLHPDYVPVIAVPVSAQLTQYQPADIVLRDEVMTRLQAAGQELQRLIGPSAQIRLGYGYRPIEEQRRLFNAAKRRLRPAYPDERELERATHLQVAVPDVAGHPTGGAVDVEIWVDGAPIDMGSPFWDITDPNMLTFSPFISAEAWRSRQVLRRAMLSAGFAPFDGEWWHFSFGDKEWAWYYQQKQALYGPVSQARITIDPPTSQSKQIRPCR